MLIEQGQIRRKRSASTAEQIIHILAGRCKQVYHVRACGGVLLFFAGKADKIGQKACLIQIHFFQVAAKFHGKGNQAAAVDCLPHGLPEVRAAV